MSEKENQRVMLTKRLLKESLLRLLQSKNIQSISVKELCEDSGINRATFYNHYGRPGDVLEELEDEIIKNIPVISVAELKENGSYKKAFIEQATILFEHLRNDKDFAALARINGDSNSEFAMKIFNFPAIKKAIDDAAPDKYDETDRQLIFKYIQSGLYSMVREWIIIGTQKSVNDTAELLAEIIDNGLVSQK
ncbi:MAG: TetR/AcrR family transcriptional regulator [Lachnospiraceae bacterium]|nr:TetR/AcrR family transcriptional regulator [Lachnospiraceae bacterium]